MINFDLSNSPNMTKEQKLEVLIDCLNIASSMSAQLKFRFDDLFEEMLEEIEESVK
jgi:hypothetical protein